jgi:hypothetical protein
MLTYVKVMQPPGMLVLSNCERDLFPAEQVVQGRFECFCAKRVHISETLMRIDG